MNNSEVFNNVTNRQNSVARDTIARIANGLPIRDESLPLMNAVGASGIATEVGRYMYTAKDFNPRLPGIADLSRPKTEKELEVQFNVGGDKSPRHTKGGDVRIAMDITYDGNMQW